MREATPMPKATLHSANLAHSAIDEAAGIISGCKLMQVGKTATFKGADGKAKSIEITPELIKGLLAHAGNRSIPANFTHDYDGEKDAMHVRLGLHKNIRIDGDGDLASDLHTAPNEYGRLAMWTAKTDPSAGAFSAVFSYNAIAGPNGKTLAVPLSFDSADFVTSGAATTAMLSQLQSETDMTKEEIQALVDAGVKAALKDYKPEGYITAEESDKRVKAALAAYKLEAPKLSEEDMAKVVAEAEGKLVAKLGGGPLLLNLQKQQEAGTAYSAKLASYVASAPNKAVAIRRMLTDHPELGQAHEEALQAEIAKLNAA